MLLLTFLFSFSALIAQECDTITSLPWTESFPTDEQGCWTFIDNDGNGHNWVIGDIHPYDGYYSLVGTYSHNLEDNWAISQAIAVPEDGNTSLSWQVFAHSSYSETYDVLVTTSVDTVLEQYEILFGETVSGGYFERQINLTSYSGQTVHVAFRHRSENQNFICIDHIQIDHSVVVDVPDVSISGPDSALVDTEITLTAVCNNGENFAWSLPDASITSLNGHTVTAIWHQAGKYTISVTASNSAGNSSATKEVVIYSKQNAISVSSIADVINVYPNPTAGLLVVEGDEIQSIEILNMQGCVLSCPKQCSHTQILDFSGFPSGIYMLIVVTKRGTRTEKVVKL